MPDTATDDNSSIFAGLIGQEHAARVLGTILRTGLPSHAYLFHGAGGSGKMEAADRFAAALVCAGGGCGDCTDCAKALRGTHPDITRVEPVGAIISVDQVREMNRSVSLRPSEGAARVYIISPAEAFNSESANAFLKTLEEPPPFVYFLLLASYTDRVLPTLVSRCQLVRFSPVSAAEIEKHLISRGGITPTMAQAFARVSRGNLALGEALQDDENLAGRRRSYIEAGERITRGGADALPAELALSVLSAVENAVEAGVEAEAPEGFITATRKRQEQDAHRRETASRRSELALALDFIETWFRDLMVAAAGAPEAVLNRDYDLELEELALSSRVDNYRRAVAVVEATRAKLGYNIDLELALQAMFYELQEVL